MISPRLLIVLFAALAVSVGLVACGGDDNEDTGGSTAAATSKAAATTPAGAAATTKPAAAATTPAGGAAASAVVKVTAKDFEFDPGDLEVPLNTKVTFQLTNAGSATHTLTVYEDDAYTKKVAGASVQASGGQSGEFSTTFTKAGDYYFRCEIHPTQMQGEIKVQ